jgi:hypothetical protein
VPSSETGRYTSPPRLPPSLISDIAARADSLRLSTNTYFSIVIHNDLVARPRLKLRKGRARVTAVKRAPMTLSIPHDLQKEGATRARRAGGTFTAYLEDLSQRDIRRGGPLTILLRPQRSRGKSPA